VLNVFLVLCVVSVQTRSGTSPNTTTIKGTITNPYPWVGSETFLCSGSAVAGFNATGTNAKYTGTIQSQRQPAQPIGGTAILNDSSFYINKGAQTIVTATLFLTPTAATGSASGVGTGSATVSGTVNPIGQLTTYHFDYGTSTNYGSQAPAPDPSAGRGTTAQTVSTP
jgi:hypothetical protein